VVPPQKIKFPTWEEKGNYVLNTKREKESLTSSSRKREATPKKILFNARLDITNEDGAQKGVQGGNDRDFLQKRVGRKERPVEKGWGFERTIAEQAGKVGNLCMGGEEGFWEDLRDVINPNLQKIPSLTGGPESRFPQSFKKKEAGFGNSLDAKLYRTAR